MVQDFDLDVQTYIALCFLASSTAHPLTNKRMEPYCAGVKPAHRISAFFMSVLRKKSKQKRPAYNKQNNIAKLLYEEACKKTKTRRKSQRHISPHTAPSHVLDHHTTWVENPPPRKIDRTHMIMSRKTSHTTQEPTKRQRVGDCICMKPGLRRNHPNHMMVPTIAPKKPPLLEKPAHILARTIHPCSSIISGW